MGPKELWVHLRGAPNFHNDTSWTIDPSDEELVEAFSQYGREKNGSGLSAAEQMAQLSQPWHPINPVPLCPIVSTHLPPVPLYVPMFSDYLYSPCIATNRWALCPVHLPIWLLNMFLFTIPVTLCSRPVILTNMIRLGELATNITELTHRAVRAVLVVSLPDPPSIAPYILQ